MPSRSTSGLPWKSQTGESLTDAVTIALRQRLARVRNTEEQIRARSDAILAMGREIAKRMTPEQRAINYDDVLYDELGLPK